jgi:hypothetical protein
LKRIKQWKIKSFAVVVIIRRKEDSFSMIYVSIEGCYFSNDQYALTQKDQPGNVNLDLTYLAAIGFLIMGTLV